MKRLLRAALGRHYDRLVLARNSEPVLRLSASLRKRSIVAAQRRNEPFFAFDIAGAMGLGGTLSHAVLLASHADAKGLIPAIRSSNPLYCSDCQEDWLSEYFDQPSLNRVHADLAYSTMVTRFDYSQIGVPTLIGLDRAHQVFSTHFPFSSKLRDWLAEADVACRINGNRLGVHYRGTDKRLEAGMVEFDQALSHVDRQISAHADSSVFLATDDAEFAQVARSTFPRVTFHMYEMHMRDAPGTPRHFSSLTGEDKAREALVNMIALSNCRVLIRTASMMSAWSRILNPSLETHTVSSVFNKELFPESAVFEAERRPAKLG